MLSKATPDSRKYSYTDAAAHGITTRTSSPAKDAPKTSGAPVPYVTGKSKAKEWSEKEFQYSIDISV